LAGEGGVIGGTGSGSGRPAGDSAGTTNCTGVSDIGGEDVGSGGGKSARAEPLFIGVGEAGKTEGNGAGLA
jgi:hypothetical protein